MKESIIIQINEKNYINRYNELKIIKSISKIDPQMISMISKKRIKEKILKLEKECRRLKIIINQIQIEKLNAPNDKEYERLEEVWGYYVRDLKKIKKEIEIELSKL